MLQRRGLDVLNVPVFQNGLVKEVIAKNPDRSQKLASIDFLITGI